MSTDIATASRTRLLAGYRSAKASLSKLREAAEVAVQRSTIAVAAPVAGYANGYVHGWAERTGKDLTIGDSDFTYNAAAGVALAVGGAIGSKMLGETVANAALGVGAGILASEASVLGYKSGIKPPAP